VGDETKGGNMRHATLLALLALLAALLITPGAFADSPTREELPPAGDSVDTFCGFPIFVDFEEAQPATVTIFYDQAGNLIRSMGIFPGHSVTLTNLDTGESLAHDLSGSGVIEFHADNSTTQTATGPWGIWARMNGIRGRFITVGRVIEVRDATGALVSRTLEAGRLIDVCAELAP
jgi:hypothetical protein